MQYQIISFDKKNGSIQVLFLNNNENVGIWNIDIPLNDDGNYITGEELEQRIMSQYPSWVIERNNKIFAGIPNEAEIEALVIPLPPPIQDEEVSQPKTVGTLDA